MDRRDYSWTQQRINAGIEDDTRWFHCDRKLEKTVSILDVCAFIWCLIIIVFVSSRRRYRTPGLWCTITFMIPFPAAEDYCPCYIMPLWILLVLYWPPTMTFLQAADAITTPTPQSDGLLIPLWVLISHHQLLSFITSIISIGSYDYTIQYAHQLPPHIAIDMLLPSSARATTQLQ